MFECTMHGQVDLRLCIYTWVYAHIPKTYPETTDTTENLQQYSPKQYRPNDNNTVETPGES